jgi:hypothetical protein
LKRRAEVLLRAEQRPQYLELLIGEPDYPHPANASSLAG